MPCSQGSENPGRDTTESLPVFFCSFQFDTENILKFPKLFSVLMRLVGEGERMRKKLRTNTTIIILSEEQQKRMANLYRKLELHSTAVSQQETNPQIQSVDEDKTRVINLMQNPYLNAA